MSGSDKCPVLVPPQARGLVGPWGCASPSAGWLCPHHRLLSGTAMLVLSRGGAGHWDHSFVVMPSPDLASCPPKFQEDFSATANTGQSLADKNIGLTSCPWCPPSTSAHQESAMARRVSLNP